MKCACRRMARNLNQGVSKCTPSTTHARTLGSATSSRKSPATLRIAAATSEHGNCVTPIAQTLIASHGLPGPWEFYSVSVRSRCLAPIRIVRSHRAQSFGWQDFHRPSLRAQIRVLWAMTPPGDYRTNSARSNLMNIFPTPDPRSPIFYPDPFNCGPRGPRRPLPGSWLGGQFPQPFGLPAF